MGMSTNICGVRSPDEKWVKRVKAWKACVEAGISPPEELQKYFDDLECWTPEIDKGPEICLIDTECCQEYNMESTFGFEIELSKLPEGITHIIFYNGW